MINKKYNSRSRSLEKWDIQFKIAQKLFILFDDFDNDYEKQEYAKSLRNPIIFDNNVKETTYKLNYYIPTEKDEKYTNDHLVGMSNIVLYIYKNKLYQKWESIDDFKMTLKALSVLLKVPKSLNDSSIFKSWQFNYNDIDNCILWDIKLKKAGIEYLIDKNKNKINIKDAWSKWWDEFEEYLS